MSNIHIPQTGSLTKAFPGHKKDTRPRFPKFRKTKRQSMTAVIEYLDGTFDRLRLDYPYTPSGFDVEGFAVCYLSKWIQHNTQHYWQIKSYQFFFGGFDKDGRHTGGPVYEKHEIPLGKIYMDGKWLTLEEAVTYERTKYGYVQPD